MNSKAHYSAEQLEWLDEVHKLICEMRDVDPTGIDGSNLAAEILAVSGEMEYEDLLARFTH
jgi:hypothetical protein